VPWEGGEGGYFSCEKDIGRRVLSQYCTPVSVDIGKPRVAKQGFELIIR